ncbi:MAG: hypothetical protein WEB04_04750 [Dehalococcoidia bacterium]
MEAPTRETRDRLILSVLAAVLIALFLSAFFWVGLFVGIYLVVLVGMVTVGFWLVSTGNRAAVITGYGLVSIAIPAVAYAVLAFPVYLTFYGIPLDRRTESDVASFIDTSTVVTAFKVGFWVAYATHVFLTVSVSQYVAKLQRVPLLVSLLGSFCIVAVASLPTLHVLSFWNSCIGVDFPFGGKSCG